MDSAMAWMSSTPLAVMAANMLRRTSSGPPTASSASRARGCRPSPARTIRADGPDEVVLAIDAHGLQRGGVRHLMLGEGGIPRGRVDVDAIGRPEPPGIEGVELPVDHREHERVAFEVGQLEGGRPAHRLLGIGEGLLELGQQRLRLGAAGHPVEAAHAHAHRMHRPPAEQ